MSNPASAGRCFYNSSGTRCSFFAAVLASARRFTSSFSRMWLTWVFTVGSFTSMIRAISALDLSAQSRWRICSSVGVQRHRQSLAPPLVPLTVQSNCRQHIQVYAVDMPCAVSHIFLKGCKGQQSRVVSAFGKLCHSLSEILISLHHIQVHQILRGLSAVPFLRFVPIARK